MSLSLYSPKFRRSIFDDDWIFSDPFRDEFFSSHNKALAHWNPSAQTNQISPLLAADVMETDTEFKVLADLPGVDPKDLELTLDNNMLTMKAERKHTHETNKDNYHSLERSYGCVQRRIRLPKNADMDRAETNFHNGVLTVTFPKLVDKPAEHRRLAINCEPQQSTITQG